MPTVHHGLLCAYRRASLASLEIRANSGHALIGANCALPFIAKSQARRSAHTGKQPGCPCEHTALAPGHGVIYVGSIINYKPALCLRTGSSSVVIVLRGGYRIDRSVGSARGVVVSGVADDRASDGVVQVIADVVIAVVVHVAEPGRNVWVFVVVGVCVVVVGDRRVRYRHHQAGVVLVRRVVRPVHQRCDGLARGALLALQALPGRPQLALPAVDGVVVLYGRGAGQLLAAVQIQQRVGLDERRARARVARVAVVLARGEAVQEDVRVRVQARAAWSSHFSNWPGPSSGRNWEASKEGTVGYGVGNAVG